jgi:hypothetical protein
MTARSRSDHIAPIDTEGQRRVGNRSIINHNHQIFVLAEEPFRQLSFVLSRSLGMARFIPNTYKCPEHGVDLTVLVKARLGLGSVIGVVGSVFFGWLSKKEPGPTEFEVVVYCPGTEASRWHMQTFTGAYER